MELDKERTTEETIGLLKEKIASNISGIPVVVKRLKQCISRIEELDSCNGIIQPVFKKRKNWLKVEFQNWHTQKGVPDFGRKRVVGALVDLGDL